jgi:hypothetical protein
VNNIPTLPGVLEILPDYRYREDPGILQYEDINRDERDNNSWWYLHGELEDIVCFDKGTMVNCKTLGYSKPTVDWISIYNGVVEEVRSNNPRWCAHINGIIKVKCIGIDEPCLGIFWTTRDRDVEWKGKMYPCWSQRGLVCLASDIEGLQYAAAHYNSNLL